MFSMRRKVYKYSTSFKHRLTIAFRRKHHCRICGRIFDDKCTTYIPGARFGHQERIRVCNSCRDLMDEYDDLQDEADSNCSSSTIY